MIHGDRASHMACRPRQLEPVSEEELQSGKLVQDDLDVFLN
jgi:hypothetical protein